MADEYDDEQMEVISFWEGWFRAGTKLTYKSICLNDPEEVLP